MFFLFLAFFELGSLQLSNGSLQAEGPVKRNVSHPGRQATGESCSELKSIEDAHLR